MRKRDQARGPVRRAVRDSLSYANVIATLALIVAVTTGGAYAASKIGAGDIAKDAVRTKHIKGNQV
jgi:hypothetical protein